MKKLIIAIVFISQLVGAQSKGTVTGILTDGEMNNEPLPFANVLIKGTVLDQVQILMENIAFLSRREIIPYSLVLSVTKPSKNKLSLKRIKPWS